MAQELEKYLKAAKRLERIESGHFMKPATTFFRDKKKYTRKQKHK